MPHRVSRRHAGSGTRDARSAARAARRVGRGGHRRADAAGRGRDDRLAGGVPGGRAPAVRSVRHADDCRRGAHRLRPHRAGCSRASTPPCRPTSSACRRRSRAATCRSARPSRPKPIYDAFLSEDRTRTFFHGHSFTANPLACAVAIASLDLFHETGALARVAALERWLRAGSSRCAPCRSSATSASSAASASSSWSRTRRRRTAGGYLDQIGPRLTAAFLERGLLLRPLGNVLYLMPPYVITEAETAWALEQVTTCCATSRCQLADRAPSENPRSPRRHDGHERRTKDPHEEALRAGFVTSWFKMR